MDLVLEVWMPCAVPLCWIGQAVQRQAKRPSVSTDTRATARWQTPTNGRNIATRCPPASSE
eukprot:3199221-Karenia_brevis.AAC.1